MNDRAIRKYLAAWAEPESALAGELDAVYDEVVVVPARRERASLADEVCAWEPASGRALVILVENESEAGPASARAAPPLPRGELVRGERVDLLRVDRASPGRTLAAREGVGRARKIGGDIALALAASGGLASPWIHMTDADARLNAGRFEIARQIAAEFPSVGAVVLPFRHVVKDAALLEPMCRHEIWMRYHAAGLAGAGSPYAFPAIGSVIAVQPEAYARVRGVPNREAGEDFHFLDKVAKVASVRVAGGAPVDVLARLSDRVPFGTGPALAKIAADLEVGREMHVLDPACYAKLGAWIAALDRFAVHGDVDGLVHEAERASLAAAAAKLGARERVAALALRYARGPALRRHLHTWFDGLLTLRFLHALRDGGMPAIPWRDALARAPFLDGFDDAFEAEDALRRLRARAAAPGPLGLGVSEGS